MTRGSNRGTGTGMGTATAARQRGMSMTAIMAVTGVSIFIGLFAIKAGPAYMENMTVRSIADDTAANGELMNGSRSKVYRQLNAQYRMNNLWDLDAEDTVDLKKDGERGYVMTVAYERRENLFANIDLVMRFDEEAGAE